MTTAAEAITRSQAVVLRCTPYRDADLVVHLFTETLGRVGAVARAARRSTRRFGGALQAFVLVTVTLRPRPGRDLLELVAAQPEHVFALSSDPLRLGRAGYLCELVEVLTRERDPLPGALALLRDALDGLGQPRVDPTLVLRAFERLLLELVGLWPDTTRCARCGVAIDDAAPRSLAVGGEGVLCRDCGDQPLSPSGLRLLQLRDIEELRGLALPADEVLSLGRLAQLHIRALAPRPLRSVAYLRQLQRTSADEP